MKNQPTTSCEITVRGRFLILLILAVFSPASIVCAQTSTFTYQGRITDGGTAANGTYDMQFKLFDGANNQIGSTITNSGVAVSSGVFTVQLDYGANAFTGGDRFLEIAVRTAGDANAYTVLSPRQPLTSAVYAIRAGSATTADTATNATTATNANQLGGIAADQYVGTNDLRLSDTRTPKAGSNNYIQNGNSTQSASFNISGDGAIGGNLSANVVTANGAYFIGGLAGGRIIAVGLPNSGNTAVGLGTSTNGSGNAVFGWGAGGQLTNTSNENSFFGWNAGFFNAGSSNSFFGNSAGALNTNGAANSFFGDYAGRNNQTGSNNAFFGSEAGRLNTGDRNSFFGESAGKSNTAGANNAFFGASAGKLSNSALDSFFGAAAGSANTGGTYNSFFGASSGESNSTGNYNSFFGEMSGAANQTGQFNTFIGVGTGQTNQSGFGNTLVGADADLGANNLSNASAVGNLAYVTQSTSLVLGSINGINSASADTNIGIGTTAPSYRLNIKTATNSYGAVHTDGTVSVGTYVGDAAGWYGTLTNHPLNFFVSSSGAAMTIETGKTVRINVLGAAGSTQLCRNALNQISTCSSSLRYKKNIQPFIGGLAVLNRLRPITFDWKQGGMHDLGFGAEEVAAVEPLLVTRNAKGEVEGVKYDRISAVLVNAVKEQQAQISRQQEQIKLQQNEIESLKRLVCLRNRRAAVCK